MRLRKCDTSITRAGLCGALLMAGLAAQAEPLRLGLVIGNGNYSAFPPLPGCLTSSQNLADALRGVGFQVIARQDVTGGGLAAAISEFSRGIETAPGASAFVYLCGYAAGMNDRPFLLPVSANIGRPSDVMTQGILAKALVDVLSRGKPSRALLALDLVPIPEVPAPALDTLAAAPLPEGAGLVAVTGSPPTTGPTALSVALATGLAVPGIQSGALLTSLKAELGTHPSTQIAVLRMPSVSRPIAVDEQPPPTLSVPTQPEQAIVNAAEQAPAASQATAPMPAFPDEGAMTGGERRRVQEALARVGYYAGGIDGRFGPETRAAIRRFQHEIGAEMTGVITGTQASRLFTWQ
jgi:hypothetical protein